MSFCCQCWVTTIRWFTSRGTVCVICSIFWVKCHVLLGPEFDSELGPEFDFELGPEFDFEFAPEFDSELDSEFDTDFEWSSFIIPVPFSAYKACSPIHKHTS